MTHGELVAMASKWLKDFGCGVVFDDNFVARTQSGEKPDALGFKSNVSLLIECKATRSDFLADRNKKFRKNPELGVGDWRFYLCPAGLIKPDEIPQGWGLLYCDGVSVSDVSGIPTNTALESKKPFVGNHVNEKIILYSALRRLWKNS